MSHFAKVLNGIVQKVIIAEASFFDTFVDDSPGDWILTYKDRSKRKHYAAVGYTYDKTKDVFIPPQPYPSWTFNAATRGWDSPQPHPTYDPENPVVYQWNESTQTWDAI